MKNKPDEIKLLEDERRAAVFHLQEYFERELEYELGGLPAEMLLDFILLKIGPSIYNQGIIDAQQYITDRAEEMYGLLK
ncbi:DUF2164 domain-containing protein [Acetanaerobacterium elongatum]|uniref:Uncharacterized conserved protein, DUF2164 family n=1 Tax=Acetanaerobacterium elongatum TaxID=258515 RepID=A0A1H0D7G6_9FIRM|nr:DUF2164 domain-containing protein [Acetanaerobacterium elongatum]SDN65956.1 Uncharacterized conserved protein, DUF2164 family [Acetanaerobacterium elongatum]